MPGSIVRYDEALSAAEEAAEKGVCVYDMAVALALDQTMQSKKRAFRRRKKMVERMVGDAQALYEAAMEAFNGSAGGLSPMEAARGIVESYLNCGMDVERAKAYAKMADFAIRS